MKAIYAVLLALFTFGSARADDLVVLVTNSVEMPMAEIRGGKVVRGIHKDLGEALAQKLNRKATMLVMPRKRLAMALESGQADVLCTYLPEWVEGRHLWTQPFFPQTELLVTTLSAARPQSLADLANQPIATVLGFTYPDLQDVLGPSFVRSDTHSAQASLRKLELGRVKHVAIDKAFYDYQIRLGEKVSAHPPMLIRHHVTRCAVSTKGRVPLADVDAAITQLLREGAISKILSNYQ